SVFLSTSVATPYTSSLSLHDALPICKLHFSFPFVPILLANVNGSERGTRRKLVKSKCTAQHGTVEEPCAESGRQQPGHGLAVDIVECLRARLADPRQCHQAVRSALGAGDQFTRLYRLALSASPNRASTPCLAAACLSTHW